MCSAHHCWFFFMIHKIRTWIAVILVFRIFLCASLLLSRYIFSDFPFVDWFICFFVCFFLFLAQINYVIFFFCLSSSNKRVEIKKNYLMLLCRLVSNFPPCHCSFDATLGVPRKTWSLFEGTLRWPVWMAPNRPHQCLSISWGTSVGRCCRWRPESFLVPGRDQILAVSFHLAAFSWQMLDRHPRQVCASCRVFLWGKLIGRRGECISIYSFIHLLCDRRHNLHLDYDIAQSMV